MTTVAELEVKVGADTFDLEKGMKSASGEVESFASRAGLSSDKVMKAMAGIGGAMLAIGGASANAAMNFETAFAEVRKTVDATDGELAALEQTIRNMATDTTNPLSALDNAHETLTSIAAMGGSLGVAVDDIDEFTQVIGAMTVATDMSAESAADFAARFANVTGMAMSDLPKLGNTIVELGNKMAATESEIASFANRLSSLATFGFKPDQILGLSAAMASLGVSSELGSTNLSKTIMDINTAVAEDGGKLKTLAEAVGMTGDEFAALNATDPAGGLMAFLEALKGMDATEQLTFLKDFGITSNEQIMTLQKMASGLDTVKEGLDNSASAWESSNALMEEAEKKADTAAAGFARVNNKMNDIGITIGTRMLPGIEKATTAFGNLLDKLGDGDIGAALKEAPGILEGIGEAVAGAFGQEDGFKSFVQGAEDAALAFQIILDRIIRSIEVWAQDANLRFLEFVSGFRDTILSATGGAVDIAPSLSIEQGAIMSQLADLNFADTIRDGLYADLQDGVIDLSQIDLMEGDGVQLMSDALSMFNTDPAMLQRQADAMGFEARRAWENAMNTAFAAGDMKTVDLMLPLAVTADMDLTKIKDDIAAKLAALSTGDSEGIDIPVTLDLANSLGMDTTATTEAMKASIASSISDTVVDFGDMPFAAAPVIGDPELFHLDMQSEIVTTLAGQQFDAITTINADPVVQPSIIDRIAGDVEAFNYAATVTVDITAVPGSMNVSAASAAVQSALNIVNSTSVGINQGGASAPAYHSGGTYTPPDGGTEGPAWLKRGETVRTRAQESALQGSGGGDMYLTVYGQSPYEIADMVDRANRDKGR